MCDSVNTDKNSQYLRTPPAPALIYMYHVLNYYILHFCHEQNCCNTVLIINTGIQESKNNGMKNHTVPVIYTAATRKMSTNKDRKPCVLDSHVKLQHCTIHNIHRNITSMIK